MASLLISYIPITNAAGEIIYDNGKRRFGNGWHQSATYSITESSIDPSTWNFKQPFYYDTTLSQWFKLTYSNYDLDASIWAGWDGTNVWNANGTVVTNATYSPTIDTTGFIFNTGSTVTWYGDIVTTGTINIGWQNIEVQNTYTMWENTAYTRIVTKVTNTSGSALSNLRYWVGTRDDWVWTSDSPTKTRGNIVNQAFTWITLASENSDALKIESAGTAVLFLTTYDQSKTHTIFNNYGNFATNIIPKDPATSATEVTQDSSYALYIRLNDLAAGESDEFAWYYAAGPSAEINSIISEVTWAAAADSAAATVSFPTENELVSTNPPTVTGTGEPGDTISIYDGLWFLLATGVVDGNGDYSITTPTFPQWVNSISVTATASGATESAPVWVNFLMDSIAPTAPVLDLATNFSPLTGTGEPNSIVTIYDDQWAVIGTGSVDGSGNFSIVPSLIPSSGDVNVTLIDEAGNESTPAVISTGDMDFVAPSFSGVNLSTSGSNPLFAKSGDQVTFTLEINPADTWETGNNLSFRVGSGSEITTGSFTSSTSPITSRNRNYTIQAWDEGPISITNFNFVDQLGYTLTGVTLPYTPSPNIIVDNTAPIVSFADDVSAGPVQSELINIITTDTYLDSSNLEYWFSADASCDENDTFWNNYTSWSGIILTSEANNGQYVCVKSQDLAGNISYSISANPINIDITAPSAPSCSTLPSPAADGQSVTTTCSWVESWATITIPNMVCGVESGWTVTCSGTVGTGVGDISTWNDSVTITDTAGNTNSSVTTNLNLDSTPPVTPSTAPDLQDASDTWNSNSDNITSNTTPSFDVMCTEIGSTITLYSGINSVGTHTCSDPGIETLSISPALSDGSYTLTYTETDISWNESIESPSIELTVDTGAPTAPVLDLPTNFSPLTGTGEPNSIVIIYDDQWAVIGTGSVDGSGNFSITPSPIPSAGDVNVTLTDESGNESTPAVISSGNIDIIPPVTPTIQGPTNWNPVIGTAEAGSTVTVTTPSGATCTTQVSWSGAYSCSLSPTPVDGEDISVVSVDGVGNASGTGLSLGAVDITSPTSISIPFPTNLSPIVWTGEPNTMITVYDDQWAVIGTGSVDGSGNFSITPSPIPTSGTVTLSITDEAGNETTQTITTQEIDILPPTPASIDFPTNLSPITGTGEPGAIVIVYDDQWTVIGTGSVDGSGNFSITPSTVPIGEVEIILEDPAGNVSAISAIWIESIDQTLPTILSWSLNTAISDTSAVLTWQTDELTSSEILFWLTTTTDQTTGEQDIAPRVTSHSLTLSNLLSCTRYYYNTISRDVAGNEFIDWIHSFKTSWCVGESPIIIDASSDVIENTSGWSMTLDDWQGEELVDISVPLWYNSSNPICPTGAYFQLKQLENTPILNALWRPTSLSNIVNSYELSAYCTPEERVTSFDAPISVTMHYTEDDALQSLENTLSIYRYNTTTSSWEELNNCSIDTVNKTVTCETMWFSTFGIFWEKIWGFWGGTWWYDRCWLEWDLSWDSFDGICEAPEIALEDNQLEITNEENIEVITEQEEIILWDDESTENWWEDTWETEEGNIGENISETDVEYTLENNFDFCPTINQLQEVNPSLNENIFSDIDGSEYKDEILLFHSAGVVDGYENGTFQSDTEISRTEFLKVVLKSHCYDYSTQNISKIDYIDVDSSSWQSKVISKAQELGVINGDTLYIDKDLIDVNLEKWYALDRITELKRVLNSLGLYSGEIDGYYTADLIDAVYSFQLSQGIVNNQYQAWAGSWWPTTREVFFNMYPNTHYNIFRPNDTISKAEAIKILMKMSNVQAENLEWLEYIDIETDWHIPYVRTGQTLGIFNPERDNSMFYPNQWLIREDMIYVTKQLINLYR